MTFSDIIPGSVILREI